MILPRPLRSPTAAGFAVALLLGVCAASARAQDASTPTAPTPTVNPDAESGSALPSASAPVPTPGSDSTSNPASAPTGEAPGHPASANTGGAEMITKERIVQLLARANPMLWPLALCSIVALGFSLERWAALRRGRVIPKDFVSRFMERLAAGRLDRDRAVELCRAHDSPAARIFAMAARYWGQPATTIRQGVGMDAGGELIDLKRNVRVLSGTATLAPLLGLLGTVVGLIESFGALGGKVGTAKGEALAHGISLALVATAVGLAIAVVSVTLYYWFLHKIDALVKELDDKTRAVIDLICADGPNARPSSLSDRKLFAVDLSASAPSPSPSPPSLRTERLEPAPSPVPISVTVVGGP